MRFLSACCLMLHQEVVQSQKTINLFGPNFKFLFFFKKIFQSFTISAMSSYTAASSSAVVVPTNAISAPTNISFSTSNTNKGRTFEIKVLNILKTVQINT